jgi:probable Kdp system regulatory protein
LYDKILIPISRTSNLKFIIGMVNDMLSPGGEVTFLNVVPSDTVPVSPSEWRKALSAISTTGFLSSTAGLKINYRVRNSASIVRGILDESKESGHDLILFASSNYRKHVKRIFGNKIDDVIRSSGVETMVLSFSDDRPVKYEKILIPTSGYQHALKAAKIAGELSMKHGGEISVLYVGEQSQSASDALHVICDDLGKTGVKCRALIRKGPVIDAILKEAQKDYSLMMIGATERPIYYKFLLGSTADRLIRGSPCPVIMVKTVA